MTPDECRSIASEGERFLREGDAEKGIKTLERALQCNTRDLSLQCAIHSQLGNAYYACGDYEKARDNHMADLYASRLQKDVLQQAKALSNLSATYILLSDFDNAIDCAENVINLANRIKDESLECRGFYNLGLAYLHHATHSKAYEDEHLRKSVDHFDVGVRLMDMDQSFLFMSHLAIARKRHDRVMCGLGLGNLANAYFYQGKYELSIEHHEKRIELANELGDRASIRRAYSNIGNAYAQMADYEKSASFYRLALELARDMNVPELINQLNKDLENITYLEKQHKRMREMDDLPAKQCSNTTYASGGINSSFGTGSMNLCLSDITNVDEYSDQNELFEQIDRLSKRRMVDQEVDLKPQLDTDSLMGSASTSRRSSLPRRRLANMMKSFSLKKIGVGTTPKRGKAQKGEDPTASTDNRPKSCASLKFGSEKAGRGMN